MAKVQITVWGWKCERCGHEWVPLDWNTEPRVCRKCKNPDWNRPRRVTGGGKQRIETIFRFVANEFPVGERCPIERLRGVYFENFSKEEKITFYQYDFSIEYLPTNDEAIIDSIFDRLNRNVARLTPQELRHA